MLNPSRQGQWANCTCARFFVMDDHFRLILRFATGMSWPDEKPDLELGDWGGTDQSRDFETSANLSTRVIRRPLLKECPKLCHSSVVFASLCLLSCLVFTTILPLCKTDKLISAAKRAATISCSWSGFFNKRKRETPPPKCKYCYIYPH